MSTVKYLFKVFELEAQANEIKETTSYRLFIGAKEKVKYLMVKALKNDGILKTLERKSYDLCKIQVW